MNKCYINQKDIVLEEQNMYVQIDDQWLQIMSIKIDDQGFYISEADIIRYGAKVPPKVWQCPYCFRWWNLGEKCKNPDCPTNRW